ncbi:MAG: hypothetical protein KF875_01055 [Trueperaceae bacterium]|nr:hypothetical protein [Trueperaceae bacterium]
MSEERHAPEARQAAGAAERRATEPRRDAVASAEVAASPLFAWDHTLAALTDWAAAPDRGRPTADGAGWLMALRVGAAPGRVVVAELRQGGAEGRLVARVGADETPTAADVAAATEQLRWRLALDLDTRALHAAPERDPAFQPVAAALAGFHPPLFASAFQAACWTVVRQRTPPAFAAASFGRIVEYLGEAVAVPPGLLASTTPSGTALREPVGEPPRSTGDSPTATRLSVFPSAAALGEEARPALLAATNNLRKVDRLRGLADAFLGLDEGWLRAAPYDEVFAWLARLPGLGPWSAEQVAWRGLGRYERTPWRDAGALTAVGDVYAGGLTLALGSARELAERYGWLQGLWLRYLKAYPRVRPRSG